MHRGTVVISDRQLSNDEIPHLATFSNKVYAFGRGHLSALSFLAPSSDE
jgi:hypothetical protein